MSYSIANQTSFAKEPDVQPGGASARYVNLETALGGFLLGSTRQQDRFHVLARRRCTVNLALVAILAGPTAGVMNPTGIG